MHKRNDHLGPGEHSNTSSFRYLMVIDPTENETAVQLLLTRIFNDGKQVLVCRLGDFPKDRQESAYIEIISQVKQAMTQGLTVILINSGPIQTSFYDVFNRHFVEEFVRNPDALPGAADTHIRQYTAKLAVGSLSSMPSKTSAPIKKKKTKTHTHTCVNNSYSLLTYQ